MAILMVVGIAVGVCVLLGIGIYCLFSHLG
jgi:hypothetical protein